MRSFLWFVLMVLLASPIVPAQTTSEPTPTETTERTVSGGPREVEGEADDSPWMWPLVVGILIFAFVALFATVLWRRRP